MKKIVSFLVRSRLAIVALFAFLFVSLSNHARASYDIVSSDGSGNITFTPSGLVQPVITGVIAAVTAGAALILIWVGVKWLYRVIKGSK